MRVSSGPARVVANGIATTFLGHPLRLELEAGAVVTLVFSVDEDDPALRATTEWTDDGARLHLVNFEGTDGRGSREPVLLGEVDDESLLLHFRVFRWGTSPDHTVHYTFFALPRDPAKVSLESAPPDAD